MPRLFKPSSGLDKHRKFRHPGRLLFSSSRASTRDPVGSRGDEIGGPRQDHQKRAEAHGVVMACCTGFPPARA